MGMCGSSGCARSAHPRLPCLGAKLLARSGQGSAGLAVCGVRKRSQDHQNSSKGGAVLYIALKSWGQCLPLSRIEFRTLQANAKSVLPFAVGGQS